MNLGALIAASLLVASVASTGHPTSRGDLVGAWRLVGISVVGPKGTEPDPFFGAGTEGLLVYDPSGWFSVQIMGRTRPELETPNSRPQHTDQTHEALKAAALDSYYAYYGTWTFDTSTATVTHTARGALYPSERDAIYKQHVQVKGSTMTFTRTQGKPAQPTLQTKVWNRVDHFGQTLTPHRSPR